MSTTNPFADPAWQKKVLLEALYAPVKSEPLRIEPLLVKIRETVFRLLKR